MKLLRDDALRKISLLSRNYATRDQFLYGTLGSLVAPPQISVIARIGRIARARGIHTLGSYERIDAGFWHTPERQ
jgi:hypothetical protein